MWPFRLSVDDMKEKLAGKIARRQIFSKIHYDDLGEIADLEEEIAILQHRIEKLENKGLS